jgi:hypothetical protein
MARVWANSQQSGGGLLVMLALADFANDEGECWPSILVLAQKARLSEREVQYLLPKLEQTGELRLDRSNGGRNRRNRYIVTVTENPEDISVKKLHHNRNGAKVSVIFATENGEAHFTRIKPSGTINKNKSTESDKLIPDSLTPKAKRKLTRPDPAAVAAFAGFYQAYPRHVARAAAEREWVKLNPNPELTAAIMTAVERYAEEMKDSEPRFIAHPATWLNSRRWEDEPINGNGNGQAKPVQVTDLGNGMVEVDGVQMDRRIFERRHGQHAN